MTKTYSSKQLIERYLSRESVDLYLDEVETANRRFNLFSRNMTRSDLCLLIAESLIPLDMAWLDGDMSVLDIGSGWGIPSVPLLLSGKGLDITLLERSKKKADFLNLLLHKLNTCSALSPHAVISLDLDAYHPESRHDLIILRQVSIDDRIARHLKRMAFPLADLICFGSGLPQQLMASAQVFTYSIDGLPDRKIVKTKIF